MANTCTNRIQLHADKATIDWFEELVEDFTEVYSEENKAKLLKALPLLKDSQMQLIEMRFFEKRSFREMGEIIGLTENNDKVKTFRALVKLKEVFNSDNKDFGGSGIGNFRMLTSKAVVWNNKPYSAEIKLSPLGITIFELK